MPRSTRPAVRLAALASVVAATVATFATAPSTAAEPAGTPATLAPRVVELDLPVPSRANMATLAGRTTARFALVGVTWPQQSGDEAVTAQVRVRIDGRWTGWQRLTVAHGHTPDRVQASARAGTEPLWVGAADGVEARVGTSSGTPLRGAKLSLVDPGTSAQDAPAALDRQASAARTTAAAPAPYPQPAIVTRAGWGADESLRSQNPGCTVPSYTPTVKVAFVHHTVGTNNYQPANSAGLVRGIYAYHVQSQRYCDLGYNFLVDKFGRVFEGRYGGLHVPVLGAHTAGYNSNAFGVSLMGDFQTAEPAAAMMEATAKVIAWKLDGHYRNPNGTAVLNDKTFNVVAGHRDGVATECPGERVYAKLPQLRQRVFALMGAGYGTEIYTLWQQLGGEAALGGAYWLEHPVGGGRGTWFGQRDLYWSSATGAHSVSGPIKTLHRQLGNAGGALGFPRTEELAAGVAGARLQPFLRAGKGQAVYSSSRTGTHEVLDQIYVKYYGIGAERSLLGLPTTGQRAAHVPQSVWNGFERGRIYSGPQTGARMIHGAINARFAVVAVYRALGLPTSDQLRARTPGAWVQPFQKGRIYWSAGTGTWETYGPIYAQYLKLGADVSRLHLPTSGIYAITGGARQAFQGGWITWSASTGKTVVTYR